ncbi:MAG TPA: hypothetical protein VLA04_03835 [Verrucomicrobiae bacterium]|nr:hypothetical protein [Verrucomicrobiae bacterium]
MRIGIVGSMQYTEKMIALRDQLIAIGHDAYVTNLASPFIGKSDIEKEEIKLRQKYTEDAIREFWYLMQEGDAILVANFDKHGIPNYIGGNTFLEMGFAHVLKQKIFLLNPIPKMPYYETEIIAMAPIVIEGDLGKIR